MPAFNAGLTIKESIDSVLRQSYSNWELIIINDASTDNTASVIDEYLNNENRIVLINLKKNGGLPNARNEGIKNAKGKYITFLDSDDLWFPDKLATQIEFHEKHPDINISHSKYELFDKSGIVKRPLKNIVEFNYKRQGDLRPTIYSVNTVGVLTVMVNRELLNKSGYFDTNLWTMEDQDLWIRIAELGENFGYINKSLAKYRLNVNGITHNLNKYKKAYKVLIKKYENEISRLNATNMAWAYYYRYFGIAHFKKGNYKISVLYLKKSIKLDRYFLNKLLTTVSFFKALFKHYF
ncbi:glycosyltransferase family 2 protein [Mucilaginibacter corticis]|uniref:Glycosyltransferase family 2 protein n=1 Tax=Mucilaginibacter corticis TaxID=2597670 RepID=A0A556MK85_9SPHI|nr:glycosyltransferase family A protein [Mucilaginibacter corticis]TSJ40296.1 glycosyltransferase family 2 protein [Mucilaginibacter corticis]